MMQGGDTRIWTEVTKKDRILREQKHKKRKNKKKGYALKRRGR
jgi:hypothetical protein